MLLVFIKTLLADFKEKSEIFNTFFAEQCFLKPELDISIGHQTITDMNKCWTNLKLFQSDIVSKRKIKAQMTYL